MSSVIKQYINNYKLRTKSSERVRSPSSLSPSSKPIPKQITKKTNHQNILHNGFKQYNIIVNKNNHFQKGQIQIEGDLNFQNKNIKKNNINQGKNVGQNAFELMSNINKNKNGINQIKKKKNNRIPRKSPIPVPKNYHQLNLFSFQRFNDLNITHNSNSSHLYTKSINMNNKNKLFVNNHNPMNKTYNSFRQQNLNRSLSPITRSNNNVGSKLSPNPNKFKYISKSPILGTEKLKNIHSNSINKNKNTVNKNLIKKNINLYNPSKRINNTNTHQSKQMIISGDLTYDSSNNSKMNISIKSGNISLNINNNNINNHKVSKIKNKLKPSPISSTRSENLNNNISNNILNQNEKNEKDSLTISQQLQKSKEELSEKNEREKNENKEKERNLSHSKNEMKEKLKNKKLLKKIKNIYTFTHVGFDGEQEKENNQDSFFVFPNFGGNKDYYYLSVCDGHGVEGHFVSGFIKEILPYDLSMNLQDKNILTDSEVVNEIIRETFILSNEKLVDNENINSTFSGSTCVSVIYTPEKLICPNIGDSRAVLGRFDKEIGKYKSIDLTRDHKPTEEDEARRIIENDGRIQPFIDEGEFIGPQRVWVKEDDVPGLAMTRSFGDRVAATVGVISEPEIKEFFFHDGDKFIIIASDGVWEFISSQECIDIISLFYEKNDMKGCCEFLYEESKKRWLREEEVIDDITMILIFLE